jgi:hypothetical protein
MGSYLGEPELRFLTQLALDNRAVIQGKIVTKDVAKKKVEVWNLISGEFKKAYPQHVRSSAQLKDRWQKMVMKAKKECRIRVKEKEKTGGGAPLPEIPAHLRMILELMADDPSFSGLDKDYQSGDKGGGPGENRLNKPKTRPDQGLEVEDEMDEGAQSSGLVPEPSRSEEERQPGTSNSFLGEAPLASFDDSLASNSPALVAALTPAKASSPHTKANPKGFKRPFPGSPRPFQPADIGAGDAAVVRLSEIEVRRATLEIEVLQSKKEMLELKKTKLRLQIAQQEHQIALFAEDSVGLSLS